MRIFIVTISEARPCHENEISVKAFSSQEKSEAWIGSQIAELVQKHDLNPDTAVDGWFVEICRDHTFQYNVVEEEVR